MYNFFVLFLNRWESQKSRLKYRLGRNFQNESKLFYSEDQTFEQVKGHDNNNILVKSFLFMEILYNKMFEVVEYIFHVTVGWKECYSVDQFFLTIFVKKMITFDTICLFENPWDDSWILVKVLCRDLYYVPKYWAFWFIWSFVYSFRTQNFRRAYGYKIGNHR